LRVARHVHVVRDQDDGVAGRVQFFQDAQHFLARVRVQRAGRFVRQDDVAAVHQRARDTHALLLAARQLPGAMAGAVAQAQAPQQFGGALQPGLAALAGIDGRHLDVALRRQVGQQVIALENEAEVFAAQFGQFVRVQLAGAAAVHAVVAAGGAVQAAQDVHQGRLARARRADDGHHFPGLDGQVDVLEHGDGLLARGKLAADPGQRNKRSGHLSVLRRPPARRRPTPRVRPLPGLPAPAPARCCSCRS